MKKIGIQLYSVRDHFTSVEEAEKTLVTLKKLGYDEVQLAGTGSLDDDTFLRCLNKAGLTPTSDACSLDLIEEDPDKVIAHAKKFGIDNVFLGILPKTTEQALADIDRLNRGAKRLSKEGIHIAYHNHAIEFVRQFDGKNLMELLLENLDRECTSFIFDTAWVQYAGCDVCSWLETMGNRISNIHLKDLSCSIFISDTVKGDVLTDFAPIGDGNMDFFRIIETAERVGIQSFCVEQDNCPYDFEESLKHSSDFLHQNFMR